MSNSTDFCQCCSTSDNLVLLKTQYRIIIKSYFSIKIRDDSCYICPTCVSILIDIEMFRREIVRTQETLQEYNLQLKHVIPSAESIVDVPSSSHQVVNNGYILLNLHDGVSNDDIRINNDDISINIDDISNYDDDIILKEEINDFQDLTENSIDAENSNSIIQTFEGVRTKEYIQVQLRDCIESEKFASDTQPNISVLEEDNYTCRCGEEFVSEFSLKNHMKVNCPEFICETCGKGFISESSMRHHGKSHQIKPTGCKGCGLVFDSYRAMLLHRKEEHYKNYRHTCRVCRKRFCYIEEKKQHLADVHALIEKKFNCPHCPASYLMYSKLTAHIKHTHREGKKKYTCNLCSSTYHKRRNFREHLMLHTGERPYQCELCHKAFIRKSSLRTHLRIHNEDKRFKCEVCTMAFVRNSSLTLHMNVHNKTVFS